MYYVSIICLLLQYALLICYFIPAFYSHTSTFRSNATQKKATFKYCSSQLTSSSIYFNPFIPTTRSHSAVLLNVHRLWAQWALVTTRSCKGVCHPPKEQCHTHIYGDMVSITLLRKHNSCA